MSCQDWRNTLAPSTCADSYSSGGSVFMSLLSAKVQKPVWNAVLMSTPPPKEAKRWLLESGADPTWDVGAPGC